MEDKKNIRMVCKACAEKAAAETQANLPALSELVGKYVKKKFGTGDRVEHMWVEVTAFNEEVGTLIGRLNNDPAIIEILSIGDEVVVYRNEIEAIIE
jgi:uncharacterized protein YegJ (DUF2314 family)